MHEALAQRCREHPARTKIREMAEEACRDLLKFQGSELNVGLLFGNFREAVEGNDLQF